jgi:hypothetical protein
LGYSILHHITPCVHLWLQKGSIVFITLVEVLNLFYNSKLLIIFDKKIVYLNRLRKSIEDNQQGLCWRIRSYTGSPVFFKEINEINAFPLNK